MGFPALRCAAGSIKMKIDFKGIKNRIMEVPISESKLDESPSVSPNGNVIIYAITDNKSGMIAGVTLSGATFVLPATNGKVREPAWSGYLR